VPHAGPAGKKKYVIVSAKCKKRGTHLDALSILQTVLKHPENCIRLEIHDKVRATGEDTERAVARARICSFTHGEGLSLQCVPRPTALHRVVGQVAYSVDGFSADRVDLFVQEGMQEEALNGGKRLNGETIIEGHARRFRARTGRGAEKEASKENEGEGAHLGVD